MVSVNIFSNVTDLLLLCLGRYVALCDNVRQEIFGVLMQNHSPIPQVKIEPFFVIPGLATERGQAVVRVGWVLIFTVYLVARAEQFESSWQYKAAWALTLAHLVFATAVLMSLRLCKGDKPMRRVATITVDQGLLAALLYLTGEIAAPFALIPIFVTFGAGLRYGRSYAVFSSLLSSGLTSAVLMTSPYWSQYSVLRFGLAATTICLPLYVFRLTDAIALAMRTDSLTHLRNRVGFDELLNAVCKNASAAKSESAVVLIDLDGFKQVNDQQGHDGGDAVLKHVGYWLSVELGRFGVPARFGGDEFAVVVERLKNRAELEAALSAFLDRTAEVGKLFDSPLGASMGVFYIEPRAAVTARFVFKAADKLMYEAKKLGKNQFVTSASYLFTESGELLSSSSEGARMPAST